jgi:Uma2 family endonuclease
MGIENVQFAVYDCAGGSMPATKAALTWDEFLEAGKPGQRWEYIDGEVEFMPPTGGEHGLIIHQISAALAALDAREWACFGADVAFTMANGDWLCPDAAVVRRSRFEGGAIPTGPVPFPPDVAFEVCSPGDKASEVERKQRLYHANRVVQGWVDFQTETAEVIASNRPVRFFGPGETATIEELPGFELNLFPLPPERNQ